MNNISRTVFSLFILLSGLMWMALGHAYAKKRVALVIGISAYEYVAELPNPKNDANAIAASLNRLGFEVITGLDLNRPEFIKIIRKFSKAIRGADIALLFFAGHGLQVSGRNYLAPIETQLLDEADLEFEAIRLETIMGLMENEPRTNLVFLDACRNNPLSRNLARSMGTRSTNVGRGLATIETGIGTLIAFATQPGNVALDGDAKHSPFTEALVKHIETPGEDIAVLLRRVRRQVIDVTNGKQVPWSNSSLTSSVILKEKPKEKPKPDNTAEIAFWNSISDSEDQLVFEAYLRTYKKGLFVELASARIELIGRKQEAARKALEATLKAENEAQAARIAEAERNKQRALNESIRAKQKALSDSMLAEEQKLSAQHKVALEQAEKARKASEVARIALEERLAEIEKAKDVDTARQKRSQNNQIEVASLDRSEGEVEIKSKTDSDEEKKLTRQVQIELNRIGCDAGKPDGIWGKGSRRALKQYGRFSKVELASFDPSKTLLDQLKAKKFRICPLVCNVGFEKQNDICIKLQSANLDRPAGNADNRVLLHNSNISTNRPNADLYSTSIWPKGKLPSNRKVSKKTKYGLLVCSGANSTTGQLRNCSWN